MANTNYTQNIEKIKVFAEDIRARNISEGVKRACKDVINILHTSMSAKDILDMMNTYTVNTFMYVIKLDPWQQHHYGVSLKNYIYTMERIRTYVVKVFADDLKGVTV